MKRQITPKFKLSAAAIAVTYALSAPSHAWAQEQNNQNVLSPQMLANNASNNLSHAASGQIFERNDSAKKDEGVTKTSQTFTTGQPIVIPKNIATQKNTEQNAVEPIRPKRDPLSEEALLLASAQNFATDVYRLMVNNPTSQRYLENRLLAATSTFPLRLFKRLEDNLWQPAPFMPVPDKDLSCYYGIPPYKKPLDYDPKTTPIQVESDSVSGSIDDKVVYQGNVTISQGDKQLKADQTIYDYTNSIARAEGNILFTSSEITASSPAFIERNMETEQTVLHDATFQMNGSVARGSSEKITLDANPNRTTLENLSWIRLLL